MSHTPTASRRQRLARLARRGLLMLPGVFLLLVSGLHKGALMIWLTCAGLLWIVTVIQARRVAEDGRKGGWLPDPGSLGSWLGLLSELAGHLLLGLGARAARVPLKTPMKALRITTVVGLDPARKCFLAALARHRRVTERRKYLSIESRAALAGLHLSAGLACSCLLIVLYGTHQATTQRAADLDREAVAHGRLALFYRALSRGGGAARPSSHVIYSELATTHALRGRHQAAMASLADAVEARWLRGPAQRQSGERFAEAARAINGLLFDWVRVASAPYQPRYEALLKMLEEGTTAEELAEVRSGINPEGEQVPVSDEEIEERRWAEALIEASG